MRAELHNGSVNPSHRDHEVVIAQDSHARHVGGMALVGAKRGVVRHHRVVEELHQAGVVRGHEEASALDAVRTSQSPL
eukprot:CAMPEP_0114233410 /NCGR_PEP_ID=MMETSP0058-20121206/5151_1 /TAXON_ID=36894 /ORGANISM="Pyramimonas parkeae, CCMP726" /LENGTH=77 /DNA_ID=CAMNT_0001345001 /DNA_START=337 /DNA_END=570 /DNA_ORIENTATION=-